jgi:RNA polymerase sigma-70 factor (ECF subfamily)
MQKALQNRDKAFLIRIKNGDRQAFGVLFNLYRNRLLCHLLRMNVSTEDAEDIIQDIFTKIWAETKYIDQIKNCESYLFKSVENRAHEMFRQPLRKKMSPLDTVSDNIHISIDETPEKIFMEKERLLIIQKIAKTLSSQQKRIYELQYGHKKQLKDIASELNISLSCVQNTINKINKKFRKYVEKNF